MLIVMIGDDNREVNWKSHLKEELKTREPNVVWEFVDYEQDKFVDKDNVVFVSVIHPWDTTEKNNENIIVIDDLMTNHHANTKLIFLEEYNELRFSKFTDVSNKIQQHILSLQRRGCGLYTSIKHCGREIAESLS